VIPPLQTKGTKFMPNDIYSFTWDNINKAPDSPGVYALYDHDEIIYIGQSEKSIRSRLSDHKSGNGASGTVSATDYWREVCSSPPEREAELLRWFYSENNRLPRCNVKMP
jgi:hypothetical protein